MIYVRIRQCSGKTDPVLPGSTFQFPWLWPDRSAKVFISLSIVMISYGYAPIRVWSGLWPNWSDKDGPPDIRLTLCGEFCLDVYQPFAQMTLWVTTFEFFSLWIQVSKYSKAPRKGLTKVYTTIENIGYVLYRKAYKNTKHHTSIQVYYWWRTLIPWQ